MSLPRNLAVFSTRTFTTGGWFAAPRYVVDPVWFEASPAMIGVSFAMMKVMGEVDADPL